MKILFRLTYYVWMLCLLFTSCRSDKDYPEAIQKAIACMESHPDSAKIYLASLDSVIAGEPEETRMYHALLTTQANDKLYITHTSDSVMRQVVRFYDTYGDADKRMLSYHYLGSVYRDLNDAPRAIQAYQQAADAGKESRQYNTLARIHNQMGVLYAYQDLFHESLEATRVACEYYQKANNQTGVTNAYRNMARAYEYLGQLDSTEFYYQKAYQLASSHQNKRTMTSILCEYTACLVDHQRLQEAEEWMGLLSEERIRTDAIVLNSQASIYHQKKQYDKARIYYNLALEDTLDAQSVYLKSSIHRSLARLDSMDGKFESAYSHLNQMILCEDSIKAITQTETIGKIHALYTHQRIEKENQRLVLAQKNSMLLNYCLSGIIVFICIMIVFFWIGYKRKMKNQYEQRARVAVLSQTSSVTNAMQTKEQLKDTSIYRFLSDSNNQSPRSVTHEHWMLLQQTVNDFYPQFLFHLKVLYPSINDEELQLCYLVKIGLTNTAMANILGRLPQSTSMRRKRLYEKIHGSAGKASDFDRFILDL